MEECVTVTGIRVTQPTLERVFAELRARHWMGIPEWFRPELRYFGPIAGGAATAYPEQIVHDMLTTGAAPQWLARVLAGEEPEAERRDPMRVMEEAGFPRLTWTTSRPWDAETPESVSAWARGLAHVTTPWLWVTCQDDATRSQALAQLAIEASARVSGILYRTARDMCEEVSSAAYYGENSKFSIMVPYRECGLLIIDGLGSERKGRSELSALDTILDARSRDMRPTVLASRNTLKAWFKSCDRVDRELSDELGRALGIGLSGYAIDEPASERRRRAAENMLSF